MLFSPRQWRIQDFPEVGAPTLARRLAPTCDCVKFSQKLHEIERTWTPAGSSKILLCRSATAKPRLQFFSNNQFNPNYYFLLGVSALNKKIHEVEDLMQRLHVLIFAPFFEWYLWSFRHILTSCLKNTTEMHSTHFKTVRKTVQKTLRVNQVLSPLKWKKFRSTKIFGDFWHTVICLMLYI